MKILGLIILVLTVLFVGLLILQLGALATAKEPNAIQESVVYNATLSRFSTSGDMRFRWYDIKTQSDSFPGNPYAWFFAAPEDIYKNDAQMDAWVSFIEDHGASVFQIIGTRGDIDCDYYKTPGLCLESINITSIAPILK